MSIDKIAETTANWINNSKSAQKVFKKISDNSAKVSVATANTANFVLRPILTMASSANKWDGAYASSSSIASGVSETVTSKALLKPFQKELGKSVESLNSDGFFNYMGEKLKEPPEKVQNRFINAMGRLCLIFLVPVNGLLKMNLHPRLAKGVHNLNEAIERKRKIDTYA